MIPAKPTRLGRWFWGNFSKWGIRVYFHDFLISPSLSLAPDQSVLLLGNHISWWDGFWPLEMNRRLWKKAYYVMMLEKELRQRPFMRQGGAFSIHPQQRSMLTSLSYAGQLLTQPGNLVLIYPQGKIHSLYENEVVFRPGVERMIRKYDGNYTVVLFVACLDFGAHPRPTLYFYLKEVEREACLAGASLSGIYEAHYREAMETHISRLRDGPEI